MRRCWRADPSQRPTFNELASILDKFLQLVAGCTEFSMTLPVHVSGDNSGYEGYEKVEITSQEGGKMTLRTMHTCKGQFCIIYYNP